MKRFWLPALLAALVLSGCGGGSEEEGPATVPVSNGQGLFLTHCASCHAGAGDPPGPNAVILGSSALQTDETFRKFLRKPSSPMMPPFDEQTLTDGEIHELFVYFQKTRTSETH